MSSLKKTKILHEMLYNRAYSRAFFTLWGQVIQECKVSFRQFFTIKYPVRSLFRTAGNVVLNICRLAFGRSVKLSYSFTGEDQILEALIKKKIYTPGFYIDVGCNHPTFLSNTYLFYKRGWRGICIDPNLDLIKKYELMRPNDIAVCVLVSDENSVRDFYFMSNNVLSTTEKRFVQEYEEQGLKVTATKIKCETLTQILDRNNAPTSFDILSIDAEEHDFQVIRSLDFSRYKPELIILENEEFSVSNYKDDNIYSFLTSQGYFLEGYILKNVYFRKK